MRVTTWEARTNRKISLVRLAESSGLSKSTLNNIENEKTSPTLEQLEAIAGALNMAIIDLFESDIKDKPPRK